MKKKVLSSVALALTLALAVGLVFTLVACNKNKTKSFTDIFKSSSSVGEFTDYEEAVTIPEGWELYVNSGDTSDSGYIPSLDAFVIKHTGTGALSILRCNDKRVYFEDGYPGMILAEGMGVSQLRIKEGYIACKFDDGTAGAYDISGKTVLSRTKISKASASSANVDAIIKILGGGFFAVSGLYANGGMTGYTAIFRPTTTGSVLDGERGELVCHVLNEDGNLSYVNGFDGRYVSVVGNSEGNYIYRIPDHVDGEAEQVNATLRGTFESDGRDDYYCEITYMGGGRFFVHEDWTVSKTDDYMYTDGSEYYMFERHIYTPENDGLSEYTANRNKLFLYMTNNYYGSDKAGIDTSSYLNDGYTYASYALTIIDRVGYYDQFILDSDLNVVMSLTGNYGVTIKDQKKEKVGHFDLIMTCVDGYYYTPLMPSAINIYDKNGNRVGGNGRTAVTYQELSNNIIIAAAPDKNGTVYYGAYDIYGNEVIEFKYTKLAAFRGAYTIGERKNENNVNTLYLIGLDGKEIDLTSDNAVPFSDMALTKSGSSIYKIGCYMFRVQSGTDSSGKAVYKYGVKNLNPNADESVLIEARMDAGSVLYAPSNSPTDVFVLEKQTGVSGDASYIVYRLV